MPVTDTTNPKDALGSLKLPLDIFPTTAIIAGSLGIYEGLCKYGRTNWRATPVRASVYLDACKRHLAAWTEGQEVDPKTKVPHLGNALACIAILIDAKAHGTLIDDRPLPSEGYFNMVEQYTPVVAHLQELFKENNPIQFTREYSNAIHAAAARDAMLALEADRAVRKPPAKVKRKYTKKAKKK